MALLYVFCIIFLLFLPCSIDDEQMDTDEIVEDSSDDGCYVDDDADDDYVPSEESDTESEIFVYPVQDTETVSVKSSFTFTNGGNNQDQVVTGKSSVPAVSVHQKSIHVSLSKKTEDGNRIWDKNMFAFIA